MKILIKNLNFLLNENFSKSDEFLEIFGRQREVRGIVVFLGDFFGIWGF